MRISDWSSDVCSSDLAYFFKGRLQRSKGGKLATDVNGNAAHVQARKLRSAIIAGKSSAVGNTVFVFRLPCRNLFMRARIDIGIDAIGDWRDLTHRERDFGKHFSFRPAFQIKLENAKVQREAHFDSGLADTGENDLARCDACRHGPAQFARRYDISPQAQPPQRCKKRGLGIALDRDGTPG